MKWSGVSAHGRLIVALDHGEAQLGRGHRRLERCLDDLAAALNGMGVAGIEARAGHEHRQVQHRAGDKV